MVEPRLAPTLSQTHRLRVSGSTVVTMTSEVNGKTEILTPCRSETPENIEAKLGVNDYVMDSYPLALLTFLMYSRVVNDHRQEAAEI